MSCFSRILLLGLGLLGMSQASQAQDTRYSAFGTLGYARSNVSERYQRFIDEDGTLSRDSLFGVQVDTVLTPELSATFQARVAPAVNSDKEWNLRMPWLFLSWRPSNDLTVRVGKMRLPILLYSENIDVGATFPFARLPIDLYSVVPTWDFYGISVGRNWTRDAFEVDLDGFAGWAHTSFRDYLRDVPINNPRAVGPWYEGIAGVFAGGVLTLRENDNRYRLSASVWEAKLDTLSFTTNYPYVPLPLAPGLGYYQTFNEVPGPGVPTQDRIRYYMLTGGIEHDLPAGFRLVGEGAVRRTDKINMAAGTESQAVYLALLKPIGRWTPYVYGSELRSSARARKLYTTLNNSQLPDSVPYAAVLNAAQRWAADSALVYDQRTWALGTTYALARGQVVKAEWQRTHIGVSSAFLDVPRGQNPGDRQLDVFSLSYSFAF